jgi:hypothetical protein
MIKDLNYSRKNKNLGSSLGSITLIDKFNWFGLIFYLNNPNNI